MLSQVKQQKKVLKCMYMKYDTCLNSSSVDAILVVFAYLFTKPRSKQAKNLPLCGRLKNYFVRISREYDTPG